MVVRPDGTHVLPVQNKICQNHFFKIQFSFSEKLERADVFLILWDSCDPDNKNKQGETGNFPVKKFPFLPVLKYIYHSE